MRNLLKHSFLEKLWNREKDTWWMWAMCLGIPLLVGAVITTHVLIRDATSNQTVDSPSPQIDFVTAPVSTNEILETTLQPTPNTWITNIVWGVILAAFFFIVWFKRFRKEKKRDTTRSEGAKETPDTEKTRGVWKNLVGSVKKVTILKFMGKFLLRAFVIFVVLFAGYMLMTTVFTSVWYDTVIPWVDDFKQNRPTEYWISALVIGAFLLFLALPSKKLEGDEKKKRDELREKLILWPFGLVKLCLVMFVVVAIPSLFISDALRDNRSPSQHKAEIAAGVNSRARVTHEPGPRRVTAKMEGFAEKGRWTKSYSLGKYSMVVQDAPILVMPNNNESEAFLAIPGIVSGPGVGKLLKAAFRVPEDSPHDTVRFVIEYYE